MEHPWMATLPDPPLCLSIRGCQSLRVMYLYIMSKTVIQNDTSQHLTYEIKHCGYAHHTNKASKTGNGACSCAE